MTVIDILNKTTSYFRTKGVDSPRLTAELLLSEVLNCKRLDLYLNFDKPLSVSETDAYREYVRRRGLREPYQYIIGKAAFMDFDVRVGKGCLIPRPETASILEVIEKVCGNLSGRSILDIGTGSGIIAIAVARMAPDAQVTAVDKYDNALDIARQNCRDLNITTIEFLNSDLFSALDGRKFDFILSNPPYILSADIPKLQKEVVEHEPLTALDGGKDGLDFYRSILESAPPYLLPGGFIIFEHGEGQSDEIEKIGKERSFNCISKGKDLSGKLRVIAFSR